MGWMSGRGRFRLTTVDSGLHVFSKVPLYNAPIRAGLVGCVARHMVGCSYMAPMITPSRSHLLRNRIKFGRLVSCRCGRVVDTFFLIPPDFTSRGIYAYFREIHVKHKYGKILIYMGNTENAAFRCPFLARSFLVAFGHWVRCAVPHVNNFHFRFTFMELALHKNLIGEFPLN